MNRAPSWERRGQCSWPFSSQEIRLGYNRTNIAVGDVKWCVEPVERAIEPGNANAKAERSATGKSRHAWPSRPEFPVEQHRWQPPQRLFLPGQGAAQPLEDAVDGGVLRRRRQPLQ